MKFTYKDFIKEAERILGLNISTDAELENLSDEEIMYFVQYLKYKLKINM